MKNEYYVIGQMSGTSLDGLDLAYCKFVLSDNVWQYEIIDAVTNDYDDFWRNKLKSAENCSSLEFVKINTEFAELVGVKINEFICKGNLYKNIDFIALHGHTIFHQPQLRFTTQICNAPVVAAITKQNIVYDFRSMDVALNGQGAPLVPIGDELLFRNYDYCINLGGFANISFRKNNERIAFDICPLNIVLNELAKQLGSNFDNEGNYAKQGNIIKGLFDKLNNLTFYIQKEPKSLGKEWVLAEINPILKQFENSSKYDLIRTFTEHFAFQIHKACENKQQQTVFFTGGGAFNIFLIERFLHYSHHCVVIPDEKIINFKEALIFAFLGVKRWREEYNCLKSVTGAIKDNIGGSIIIYK